MGESGLGVDVRAIVDGVRRTVELRTAGRPRTPPFDPQLTSDVAELWKRVDLYHLPLAPARRGLVGAVVQYMRRTLRRLLLPWIARQSESNVILARAMDSLREQTELLGYHQALATEDLLEAQVRAFAVLCDRWEDTAPASVQAAVESAQADVAALRADVSTARETAVALEALRSEVDSCRETLRDRTGRLAATEEMTAGHRVALDTLRGRVAQSERRWRRLVDGHADVELAGAGEAAGGAPRIVPGPRDGRAFDYFGFEERFRGPEEEIKKRQGQFLQDFVTGGLVADVGCGRGEFLELLGDAGVEAVGIDLDPDMVLCCRDKGLNVVQADIFTWLGEQPDASLGGVFGAQVIEHFPPDQVLRLTEVAWRKLRPGAPLIFESVNPATLSGLASFYIDFTHVRPLHPEAMQYLFECLGFERVDVRYSSAPSSLQIPEVPDAGAMGESAVRFNPAIRRLNQLLYGPVDYAVVGRKGGARTA